MKSYQQGFLYNIAATGFLYSLIIVDICRKLGTHNLIGIRNSVYAIFFALIMIDIIKNHKTVQILSIGIVMSFLYCMSYAMHSSYSGVYSASIALFFSRLLPAFYIGRYTQDWNRLGKCILIFSPLAIAYTLILLFVPDLASGQAYATIASNLIVVTLLTFNYSISNKNILGIAISLLCFVPVLFMGTRSFFLGTIISFILLYYITVAQKSATKKVWAIVILLVIVLSFFLFGESLMRFLVQAFPDSRTIRYMASGDLLDVANRDYFYRRIISSLKDNPLKMYGLIGDRIYLSAPGSSVDDILSNFSHNCILELFMDFGVILGFILSVYFIVILLKAFRKSCNLGKDLNRVFVIIFGCEIVNIMVSASFLSSYSIWLLFGLAYATCKQVEIKNVE